VISGSREREEHWMEHWTPKLDGDGSWPWRIAEIGVPAR
jgi:hypothetical protein